MKNKFEIISIKKDKNVVSFDYNITGDWTKYFNIDDKFFVEYNFDLSSIPDGIVVIPLLCNILPIAWLFDAEIILDEIDEDFYNNIDKIKEGYEGMFPGLKFNCNIKVNNVIKNEIKNSNKVITFFSGGVDAYNTLCQHILENPILVTVHGADIKLSDLAGWKNVENHIKFVADELHLENQVVKSNFRTFLNETELHNYVMEIANDGWWHGFQHGIGIISLSAPISYKFGTLKTYFASSFTIKEKGKVTCASDPTIDNNLHVANSIVIHDGYEFNRQDKVHNIVEFKRKNNSLIKLRVCWQESQGKNCCECEKCWRTIFEIIAEGENPEDYDLKYTLEQAKRSKHLFYNASNMPEYRKILYKETQNTLKKNVKYEELPNSLKWFYTENIDKINKHYFYNFLRKVKHLVVRVIKHEK